MIKLINKDIINYKMIKEVKVKDIKLAKGCSLSLDKEGDTITLIQKYKKCKCKTVGQGEIIIKKHMERKKNCGENCLRYKLLKHERSI